MEKMDDKQPGLEENFEALENLIQVLADPEVTLENAFDAYSKGVAILKSCNQQIDQVEKKVLVLSQQGELEELDS